MGPAGGFDKHRDLVGHRQPVGSAQDVADAPGFGSSVDVFMPVRSRGASTRDSKCFVSVSMAVTGRDAVYEDPLIHGGARAEHDPIPRRLASEPSLLSRYGPDPCISYTGQRRRTVRTRTCGRM